MNDSPSTDETVKAQRAAVELLHRHIPSIKNVHVASAQRGSITVGFTLNEATHSFLLMRTAGIWHLKEWVMNGHLQPSKHESGPRFQQVIATTIGVLRKAPLVKVVDLRCPEKHRQLFARVIVQAPLADDTPSNLIEVACPWCKRATGVLTYHYYSADGSLVKTEKTDPYIKQEPGAWFQSQPKDLGSHAA